MGKASSSKKVARAARAAGRPGAGRNLAWPSLIGVVVVLGVLLIVLSRGNTEASVAPKLGDHWHAAYGIYDCDHFIASLVDVVNPEVGGLHTHGDGLMHMHPTGTRYTGKNANLKNWGANVGLDLTDSSVTAAGIARKNGDECADGSKGTVQVKVWDSPDDPDGRLLSGDYADYAPQEFTLFTIAFVAEGTDIPKPPDEAIASLQAPSDVVGSNPSSTTIPITIDPNASSTTVPGTTETTTADGGSTTAPPDTTASTEPSTTVTSAP
jgi:hypothetical protein